MGKQVALCVCDLLGGNDTPHVDETVTVAFKTENTVTKGEPGYRWCECCGAVRCGSKGCEDVSKLKEERRAVLQQRMERERGEEEARFNGWVGAMGIGVEAHDETKHGKWDPTKMPAGSPPSAIAQNNEFGQAVTNYGNTTEAKRLAQEVISASALSRCQCARHGRPCGLTLHACRAAHHVCIRMPQEMMRAGFKQV